MESDFHFAPAALSIGLVEATADSLRIAANQLKVATDASAVQRWTAHGARAGLRLAEAGHPNFALLLLAKEGPGCPPAVKSWRSKDATWKGFVSAAELLCSIVAVSFPETHPPHDPSDCPSALDIQLTFSKLADLLQEVVNRHEDSGEDVRRYPFGITVDHVNRIVRRGDGECNLDGVRWDIFVVALGACPNSYSLAQLKDVYTGEWGARADAKSKLNKVLAALGLSIDKKRRLTLK
jgi:hypothetical protein